ncbi:hypothetical protein [Erwinia sp.]|uniref:hypothetical protein n=1 Tax=Erwinia citreus TaxID=558 RepID=UPI003C77D1B8
MKKLLLSLCFCSAFACAEITPASVKDMIKGHGISAFQAQLNESDWYDIIVTKIAQGDADWIATIPWLKDIPDDKKKAALVESAQRGLIRNPKAMLHILSSIDMMTYAGKVESFDTDNICFGSLPGMSKKSYLLFYAATKHALSDVNNIAVKCRWVLESIHDEIMNDDRNGLMKWGTRSVPGY